MTAHRRLSIAYVTPRYAPHTGGVETHVAQIARRVAARGYQVEVLTQEGDPTLPTLETAEGVTVRRFPVILPAPVYPFAPGLWRFLARHRESYDLVHAHNYHAFPALGAAVVGCRPLVFTPHFHGTGHRPLGRLLHVPYRLAGALMFRRASAVVCVSHSEAALVRRSFPRVVDRLTVIPNGVDVEALRSARPYPEGRTIILSVGRLLAYKGVDRVIAALAQLDGCYALRVVGTGPEEGSLRAQAARPELRGRVRFLGRVGDEELRRWYRTAAAYVTMSAEEAFGLTLLEALAAGASIVAADIPAHREVKDITGSKHVTLLPASCSPQTLAAAIRDAAAHPDPETALPAIPSWDDVAEETLALYHRLVPSPGYRTTLLGESRVKQRE